MENRRFSVSSDELRTECLRRKYSELLAQPEVFPSAENWDFIISHRLGGLGYGLYRKFLVANLLEEDQRCDYHLLAIEKFPQYLKIISRDEAIDVVYSDYTTSPDAFKQLVFDCELFDSDHIGDIVDNGYPALAAELLAAYQPVYDGDVIDGMQFLLSKFENLPPIGSIELHKGIFKSERRYICPEGHSNAHDVIYCTNPDCGLDIYGLTEVNRKCITAFSDRITILREMLD